MDETEDGEETTEVIEHEFSELMKKEVRGLHVEGSVSLDDVTRALETRLNIFGEGNYQIDAKVHGLQARMAIIDDTLVVSVACAPAENVNPAYDSCTVISISIVLDQESTYGINNITWARCHAGMDGENGDAGVSLMSPFLETPVANRYPRDISLGRVLYDAAKLLAGLSGRWSEIN